MGYDIVYEGKVNINKPLDEDTYNLIMGLCTTRRVVYDVDKLIADGYGTKESLGIQGEFFVLGSWVGYRKEFKDYVLNDTIPPYTQPDLWCKWTVSEDKQHIEWNRHEKSYSGHEWLKYIVKNILVPRGYVANGIINWLCQRTGRFQTVIENNSVRKKRGFNKNQKEPNVSAWYQELIDDYKQSHIKWVEKLKQQKVEFLYDNEYLKRLAFNIYANEKIYQARLYYDNSFEELKVLYDLTSDSDDMISKEVEDELTRNQINKILTDYMNENPNWRQQPKVS